MFCLVFFSNKSSHSFSNLIILSSPSSVLLLRLAVASLGGISSSLVTKTCSVLYTSDETVRAKSSDSSEDGASPGSVWPPGLSYMTIDVARDTLNPWPCFSPQLILS